MSGLTITRGRHYTSGGRPIYQDYGRDLGSIYDGDFEEDAPTCDHCDEACVCTWGYPVILQEGRRWFATMYFNQCGRCYDRAQAIMDTSDHLALGKDEWDLIDSATQLITDDRWDQFPRWTIEKAKEIADGKMRHIEHARDMLGEDDAEAIPLFRLVPDVLGVIRDNLAKAEYMERCERAARTIQKGWRQLRERRFGNIELPHPCGICGSILDISDGIPLMTIRDPRSNTALPICYIECEIICRTCGCRQGESATPADLSGSPGTCYTCGTVFTCYAYTH